MQASDIAKEFQETLDEYESWINKKFELSRGWDDEVFYIMSVRDDLHNIVGRLRSFPESFDEKRLSANDRKWQEWIQNHTSHNFEFEFRRQDTPRSEWWWWIDKLPELSEEDKATL